VEHGTADVQLCYSVQLCSEEEVEQVKLDPEEYTDGCWKMYNEVLDGRYHPALKYAVRCLLASQALGKMVTCEERTKKQDWEHGASDDAELAKLAREFLKRRRDVDEMMTKEKNGYEVVSKELNYYATVTTRF
jgi:hypothetical protein